MSSTKNSKWLSREKKLNIELNLTVNSFLKGLTAVGLLQFTKDSGKLFH